MAPTKPSPLTWTIRFKNHKHTTLLHVDALQTFDSIREELLRALRQTRPDGLLPTGEPLPESSDDILLAKPVDVNDHNAGWTRLRLSEEDILDEDELELPTELQQETDTNARGSKSTSKAKRSSTAAALRLVDLSPKIAGLRDGAVLAYKFKAKESGLKMVDEVGSKDEWDVVIPSYEDTAGVVNEGDVGGMKMTL